MKLPTIQKTVASREAKDSKDNFDVECVFNTFVERYDRWYDKPFGKTAFKLEKECIESLCENLESPFLEIGVGTGRFAVVLKVEYSVDKPIGVLKFAKERGIEVIRGEGESLPFMGTTLQPPTEEPLPFELSKKGYYKEAGFVAMKTQKRNGTSQRKM